MPMLEKSHMYRYHCNSDGVDVIPIDNVSVTESIRSRLVEVEVCRSFNGRFKTYPVKTLPPVTVPDPAGAPSLVNGNDGTQWDSKSLQRFGNIVVALASSNHDVRCRAYHEYYAMRREFNMAVFDAKVAELDCFRKRKNFPTVNAITWEVAGEIAQRIKAADIPPPNTPDFSQVNRPPPLTMDNNAALPPAKQEECQPPVEAEQMSLF